MGNLFTGPAKHGAPRRCEAPLQPATAKFRAETFPGHEAVKVRLLEQDSGQELQVTWARALQLLCDAGPVGSAFRAELNGALRQLAVQMPAFWCEPQGGTL